jgi:hypothetical protein
VLTGVEYTLCLNIECGVVNGTSCTTQKKTELREKCEDLFEKKYPDAEEGSGVEQLEYVSMDTAIFRCCWENKSDYCSN